MRGLAGLSLLRESSFNRRLYSLPRLYNEEVENHGPTINKDGRNNIAWNKKFSKLLAKNVEHIGHGVFTSIRNIVDYTEIKRCLLSI